MTKGIEKLIINEHDLLLIRVAAHFLLDTFKDSEIFIDYEHLSLMQENGTEWSYNYFIVNGSMQVIESVVNGRSLLIPSVKNYLRKYPHGLSLVDNGDDWVKLKDW